MATPPEPRSAPLIVMTAGDPALAHDAALAVHKNELYAAAIRRHGGDPIVVTAGTPAAERDRLFADMDALLLAGGADIHPALYGEPLNGSDGMDDARDRLELAAWRAAKARSLPVLGVCRGLQAINVFAGGSLEQDVPSHAGVAYGSGPAHTHALQIDPFGRLGQAVGEDSLTVNTFHHQAITPSRLAPGLRATAWSDSEAGKLVEGIEAIGDRWIVGIQCHPERTESTPPQLERLWQAFVDAARRH